MPALEPALDAANLIEVAAKGAVGEGVLGDAGLIPDLTRAATAERSLLGVTHVTLPGADPSEDVSATINSWTRTTKIFGSGYTARLPWSGRQAVVRFDDGTEVTLTPSNDSYRPAARMKFASGATGEIRGAGNTGAPTVHLFPPGTRSVLDIADSVEGARIGVFEGQPVVQFDNGARSGPLGFLRKEVTQLNFLDGASLSGVGRQFSFSLPSGDSIVGGKFIPRLRFE